MPESNLFAEGRKQFIARLRAIADGVEGGTFMLVPDATSIEPNLTRTAGPRGARVQNGYFRVQITYYDPSEDMTGRVKPPNPGEPIELRIDDGTMGQNVVFHKD